MRPGRTLKGARQLNDEAPVLTGTGGGNRIQPLQAAPPTGGEFLGRVIARVSDLPVPLSPGSVPAATPAWLSRDAFRWVDPRLVEAVGRLVKHCREAAGMRAAELGEAMGYGEDLIRKVERGARIPRADFLDKADEILKAGAISGR